MLTRLAAAGAMRIAIAAVVVSAALPSQSNPREEIPVAIKELEVHNAILEFQRFQQRLEKYRTEVSEGQKFAADLSSMLDELRRSASPENNYNEEQIIDAIGGYVKDVVGKQIRLVDFLQSQRYRISYYANRMAAAVRPENVAALFGTERSNMSHLRTRTKELDTASNAVAKFIDTLPEGQFDKESFRPLPGMSQANRKRLVRLELRYQNAKNALDIATTRLRLVREAENAYSRAGEGADVNVNSLLSQMFGALDRIRLQMNMDLLYLDTFLTRFERSTRTHEILAALQQLVALQGGMKGPSPGLANVLDWLEESSLRKLTLGAEGLEQGEVPIQTSSDLLKEAYGKAKGIEQKGSR